MSETVQPTPSVLLPRPLKSREIWKSPFTDAQYAHFEKLKEQAKPINDMAVARELYHSWLWRDPRDRKEWFAKVMQSMAKKHGHGYCETIRSLMTKLKGEDSEIYNARPEDGDTAGQGDVGESQAGT